MPRPRYLSSTATAPNPFRLMPPSYRLRARAAAAGVDPSDRDAVYAFMYADLAKRKDPECT